MSRCEIGLGLQSDKAAAAYAELAVTAEAAGFDVISVFADLYFQPPIVALLEMARVAGRVRLGAACWNPYTLHPYEIAGQLAALEAAAPGRSYLGLARGSWLGDLGVAQPRPVAQLRQSIELIRALLEGDDRGLDADIYPLAAGRRLRYDRPTAMPPVLIGTWGVHTTALAGELADEIKVGGSANPAMVEVVRQRLKPGLDVGGRDADAVRVVLGAVTVVDEDGAAARARARREVAMYLDVVAELDPTVDLPPGLLTQLRDRLARHDEQGAGRLIPDDVLDLFSFSGTPEQVAAQAQRLIDAGADRVEFGTPHGLTDRGGVELLGRRVLPLLHRDARG